MPARLNRRRYREAVAALKQIISDPKTPPQRKLRAVETLLSIYDRHDRTEAQKEARKRAAQAPEGAIQPDTAAEALEQPSGTHETVDAFLERVKAKKTEVTDNNE